MEKLRDYTGPRLLAAYLVHRGLDENGELIFAPAQLDELMNRAAFHVIDRIVAAMIEFDKRVPSPVDVRKNS
jgi:hypothetical protein